MTEAERRRLLRRQATARVGVVNLPPPPRVRVVAGGDPGTVRVNTRMPSNVGTVRVAPLPGPQRIRVNTQLPPTPRVRVQMPGIRIGPPTVRAPELVRAPSFGDRLKDAFGGLTKAATFIPRLAIGVADKVGSTLSDIATSPLKARDKQIQLQAIEEDISKKIIGKNQSIAQTMSDINGAYRAGLISKAETDKLIQELSDINRKLQFERPTAADLNPAVAPRAVIEFAREVTTKGAARIANEALKRFGSDTIISPVSGNDLPARLSRILLGDKPLGTASEDVATLPGGKRLSKLGPVVPILGIAINIPGVGGGKGATKFAKLLTETDDLSRIAKLTEKIKGFAELDESIKGSYIEALGKSDDIKKTAAILEDADRTIKGVEAPRVKLEGETPRVRITSPAPPITGKALRSLAENTEPTAVRQILRETTSLADDVIDNVVADIARTQNPQEIGNILKTAFDPAQARTLARGVSESVVPKVDEVPVPPAQQAQVDELSQEFSTPKAASDISKVEEPYAATASLEAEQKVVDALPKTIKQKVANDVPLTSQEAKKVNEVRAKVNRQMGISPEQQELGLGISTPTQSFAKFEGAAKRMTPAGNFKDIAKGVDALTTGAAKRLGAEASLDPTLISRVIGTFPNLSAKKFRSLASNINGVTRRNPELGRDLTNFVLRPIEEYAAYAAKVKQSIIGRLLDVKKSVKLNKNDQLALKEVLNGEPVRGMNNPEGVQQIADEMRNAYDQWITELNKQELAAGVELTPRRQDYFPHIQELLGQEKFLAPAKQADPDFVRRIGSAFKFSKQRKGKLEKIMDDPFKVMDVYSEVAQARIRSLIPSRNINMLVDSLNQLHLTDMQGVSQFKGWLKSINEDITGGRAGLSPVERVQGRLSAGIVLGNPSSILMNVIQPTLLAGFHPLNSTKGLYNTFLSTMNTLANSDVENFLKVGGIESSYLRNAYDAIDLRRLEDKSVLRKMGDVAARAFYVTDMGSKKQVIESLFAKHAGDGIPNQRALQLAEQEAETMLPSRAPGTLAQAFRGDSSLAKALALFQTEVAAQAEMIGEAVSPSGIFSGKNAGGRGTARGLANLAGIAAAGYLFNQGFSSIFPGRRPAPDPVGWMIKAMEDNEVQREHGLEEDTLIDDVLDFVKQGVGQVPYVGSWLSGEYGTRSPFPGLEIGKDIVGSVGNVVEGVASGDIDQDTLLKAGRDTVAFLGRGAKPVYRAGEGLYEFFSKDDSKGFDTEKTDTNLIRSILGGAYNTSTAQEFFKNSDNRNQIISSFDEQTQEDYKNIIGRGFEVDGKYTRAKSVIDQGVQFERMFQNPKLAELLTVLGEFDKKNGEKVDPVFNADFYRKNNLSRPQNQKLAFRYLAAKSQEDTSEEKALEKLYPWLKNKLQPAREQFFDAVVKEGDTPEITYGPKIKSPKASEALQSKLDTFFKFEDFDKRESFGKKNPEVLEYLDRLAKFTNAKRKYLGKPLLDPFPEGSKKQQQIEDQYFTLPENNGPKGGSPDRRAFLERHPELVALWAARSVWTLQQEGSLGTFEGITLSQKGLKAVDRLASNLMQLDDGTYVFTTDYQGGSGFAKGGSGGSGSSSGGRGKKVRAPSLGSVGTTTAKTPPRLKAKKRIPQYRVRLPAQSNQKRISIKL